MNIKSIVEKQFNKWYIDRYSKKSLKMLDEIYFLLATIQSLDKPKKIHTWSKLMNEIFTTKETLEGIMYGKKK
jgi:hypothetical protein